MENKVYKVVVIVPLYNVEKYINECLESIKNQSLEDFLCLIVNDGSRDKSREIVENFINKDQKRFVLLDKENGGSSSARNFALNYLITQSISAKYISFIDSDDVILKDFFKVLVEGIEKYNADFSECLMVKWFKNKNLNIIDSDKVKILNKGELERWYCSNSKFDLDGQNCKGVCIRIFKYELVKNVFFDESLRNGEDQKFFLDLFPKIEKAVCFEKALYLYRVRKSSLSHEKDLDILKNDIKIGMLAINGYSTSEAKFAYIPGLFRGLSDGLRKAIADNDKIAREYFTTLKYLYLNYGDLCPKDLKRRMRKLKYGFSLVKLYLKQRMKSSQIRKVKKLNQNEEQNYFE